MVIIYKSVDNTGVCCNLIDNHAPKRLKLCGDYFLKD